MWVSNTAITTAQEIIFCLGSEKLARWAEIEITRRHCRTHTACAASEFPSLGLMRTLRMPALSDICIQTWLPSFSTAAAAAAAHSQGARWYILAGRGCGGGQVSLAAPVGLWRCRRAAPWFDKEPAPRAQILKPTLHLPLARSVKIVPTFDFWVLHECLNKIYATCKEQKMPLSYKFVYFFNVMKSGLNFGLQI